MLIKSENVSVVRGKKEILKNIDLELGFNDFVTIIGPNGAGKSMLFKNITCKNSPCLNIIFFKKYLHLFSVKIIVFFYN